jgi:hypothetical protein
MISSRDGEHIVMKSQYVKQYSWDNYFQHIATGHQVVRLPSGYLHCCQSWGRFLELATQLIYGTNVLSRQQLIGLHPAGTVAKTLVYMDDYRPLSRITESGPDAIFHGVPIVYMIELDRDCVYLGNSLHPINRVEWRECKAIS